MMVNRYEASERLFSVLELLVPASASDLPDIVNIHTKNNYKGAPSGLQWVNGVVSSDRVHATGRI